MDVGAALLTPLPHLLQQAHHAAEAAVLAGVAEAGHARGERVAEAVAGRAHAAGDEQGPDEAAVRPRGARGHALEPGGEVGNDFPRAGVRLAGAGHQAQQVQAGGAHEEVGDGEAAGGAAAAVVRGGGGLDGALDAVELLAQQGDVAAQLRGWQLAAALQRLEAGDLGHEVERTVLAAGQGAQAGGRAAQVGVAVGVGEKGRAAEHGGAEDVDPGGEGGIERDGGFGSGGVVRRRGAGQAARQVEAAG